MFEIVANYVLRKSFCELSLRWWVGPSVVTATRAPLHPYRGGPATHNSSSSLPTALVVQMPSAGRPLPPRPARLAVGGGRRWAGLGGASAAQLTGRFRSLRFDYSSPGASPAVAMETTPSCRFRWSVGRSRAVRVGFERRRPLRIEANRRMNALLARYDPGPR